MEFLLSPWPWYVAGPAISVILFLLLYFGKKFGLSSNLRTMCAIGGAGKFSSFFNFDWKQDIWNLVFVLGTILGGFFAYNYLTETHDILLSAKTNEALKEIGIDQNNYLPSFILDGLKSIKGILILLVGGFLIGFGTRYANGCTSGHAISGLSNLQLPSLIAVIGFFIGGLIMTHFIIPFIF
ncbi:MAG: YeeE/YedE family protein [Bacteroidetes bacterium]|nr:YeeE/YedE family protein [Bacteroidota bacterium]MBP7255756.1 YeeE/YedE family protein [Chitinophagales bacterium]MBK7138251.1 YeeE/YedE family protein [Bacteroidota bacterium]MBK7641208.1 YeeE/YedE family protein [Bacteroidota bacterium]MBK8673670.1 YeeE/YedE family protein [Bacteroidota bacterium]